MPSYQFTGLVETVYPFTRDAAVFAALDEIEINRAILDRRLSHAYAVMLIKDARQRNPSGVSRRLTSLDRQRQVAVGFDVLLERNLLRAVPAAPPALTPATTAGMPPMSPSPTPTTTARASP